MGHVIASCGGGGGGDVEADVEVGGADSVQPLPMTLLPTMPPGSVTRARSTQHPATLPPDRYGGSISATPVCA